MPILKHTQVPVEEEVPLYIRWSPDRSPYSIELRLELVRKIAAQVRVSDQMSAELGGFLIGSLPEENVPTIRIDDIEMVSNGSDDDTVFLPEPSELQRFPGVRGRTGGRGPAVIGFFRSHARIGPMTPSLADRSIFAQEFRNRPYVVLLIQTQAPHTAAFFVAASGQLPPEPSVREFAFNEEDFKALPEVAGESRKSALPPQQQFPFQFDRAKLLDFNKSKLGVYGKIAALVLIAIAACALMWFFARQAALPGWLGSGNQLNLAITPEGHLLRISWNNASNELNQATSATLTITNGVLRSEIQLGIDELRLGSVEYQGGGSHVEAKMTLNTPGGPVSGDSTDYTSQ